MKTETDQLHSACQAAPCHLILKAQTGPAEAPLSPEILELIPGRTTLQHFLMSSFRTSAKALLSPGRALLWS